MRVTISDALADEYLAYATTQNVSLDAVIEKQLKRFKTVPPGSTTVVLGSKHLDFLAEKLHGGDVRSAEDLVTKVDRLAGIKFETIDLRLTPAQLEELAHRAERQGKPVEALVQEIWEKLSVDFFYVAAGTPAVEV